MFKDIKKLLPRSLIRAGIGSRIEGARTTKIFTDIAEGLLAENNISGKIKALYLKDKTIVATALSSAVTHFLAGRKADIIAEINRRAGNNIVNDIKYIG